MRVSFRCKSEFSAVAWSSARCLERRQEDKRAISSAKPSICPASCEDLREECSRSRELGMFSSESALLSFSLVSSPSTRFCNSLVSFSQGLSSSNSTGVTSSLPSLLSRLLSKDVSWNRSCLPRLCCAVLVDMSDSKGEGKFGWQR